MSQEEILQIARQVAENEHWPWFEPVVVQKRTRGLWRRQKVWVVRTNVGSLGCNISVEIDAETGDLVSKAFGPR